MANIGRFGNKDGVGDIGAAGASFLDSANLGPLLGRGFGARESRGFKFFRQGFKLTLGFFDQNLDLFGPSLGVVEGVDHLFEREREF